MPMYDLTLRRWNACTGYGSALIYDGFLGTLTIPGPPLWYTGTVPLVDPPRKRRKHKKGKKQ